MSEATIQQRLAAALAPLVAEGSVTVNDHATPQSASRTRAPWLVIETADTVRVDTGPNYELPSVTYEPYVAVVVYPAAGQDEAGVIGAFQALRQAVIGALLAVDGIDAIETAGPLAEYFGTADGLFQRLRARIVEYEV